MYNKEKKRFQSKSIRRDGYEPLAQFESSETLPPDYLVHETRDGRLVSDSYEVEWPKRPEFGRYSERSDKKILSSDIKQSKKRHRQHKKRRSKKTTSIDVISSNRFSQKVKGHRKHTYDYYPVKKATIDETKKIDDSDNYLFVGAQTMSSVSKLLRQNDFRLYYQVPSPSQKIVPVRIPLCLAYMSSARKIYHFPITCTIDEESGGESWKVLYGDPRSSTFATLSALVKYYKIYSYMDPKTGVIDTFPIWKTVISDSDEFD